MALQCNLVSPGCLPVHSMTCTCLTAPPSLIVQDTRGLPRTPSALQRALEASQCAPEALRTFQCKLVPLGKFTGFSSELQHSLETSRSTPETFKGPQYPLVSPVGIPWPPSTCQSLPGPPSVVWHTLKASQFPQVCSNIHWRPFRAVHCTPGFTRDLPGPPESCSVYHNELCSSFA